MATELPPAGGWSDFLQTSGGRPFSGVVTRLALTGVDLVIGTLDVPTVSRGAPAADRFVVLAPLGAPAPSWNGQAVGTGECVALVPGTEHHGVNPAGLRFALLSIPMRNLAALSTALEGRDQEPRAARGVHKLAGDAPRALCAGLGQIAAAARDPRRFAAGAAADAAGHALLESVTRALDATAMRSADGIGADRTRVLRRVDSHLEQYLDRPIYLADLCAAAEVGERSLEKIFCERYGVPPVRYLRLRRLHATRRALRREGRGDTTVTEVATAHGFWHLGRFAADYAALFGEHPSETLRRRLAVAPAGEE